MRPTVGEPRAVKPSDMATADEMTFFIADPVMLSDTARRQSNISNATVKNKNAPFSLTPIRTDSATGSTIPSPISLSLRSFADTDSMPGPETHSPAAEDELSRSSQLESSMPQLIMPSMTLPARRPFTERGRGINRLKLLIAGDAGTGKTSLIKSIVQSCEDIVHVDSQILVADVRGRRGIAEIYASTRKYPHWWSDKDILERNLCFVDTPGHSHKNGAEVLDKVVGYVEAQLERTSAAIGLANDDIVSLLTGRGGNHVDAVLYLTTQKLQPPDIDFLRRLSPLTNIIPVIGRADQNPISKVDLLKDLDSAGVQPFTFGRLPSDIDQGKHAGPPWTISSAPSTEFEHMDASLMMNSDFVQPLAQSELPELISDLFDPDNIAWLKHAAAKKFVKWRNGTSSSKPGSYAVVPHSLSFDDHKIREERLAQVRLAKWATDLQKSLQNERDRYETIAQNQRTAWLQEKLQQCEVPVADMALVPAGQKAILRPNINPDDPMGLLEWTDLVTRRGWLVVQFLGSFGVVGGVIWMLRSCEVKDWRVWRDSM